MTQYLTIVLHAPLAAFGGVAVGERRGGWDRPGRSAVFGLLAAALGIDRGEEAAHLALERGYGIAIRTDAAGAMLADYHTAQVPPAQRNRRWPTRAAELAEAKLETVLTRREYRSDALHLVALWARAEAPHDLEALRQALERPRYVLYAGRKSCPLGLPLAPQLDEAADATAALAAREAKEPEKLLRQRLRAKSGTIAIDAEAVAGLDVAHRIERRRDRLASRARWQFDLRDEAVLRMPGQAAP